MRLSSSDLLGRACFGLLLLTGAALPAQAGESSTPATDAPAIVTILGASMSDGFVDPRPREDGERNSTVKLARAMRGFWDRDTARIRGRGDVTTFLAPAANQSRHIDKAVGDEPGVVIAVDFLFWFGYGHVGGDERTARLALQQQGLALLDRLVKPGVSILVGDYPDMTGADRTMLSPSQIPTAEVLAALNAGLREWAAARDNVRIFRLAEFVAAAKREGVPARVDVVDVVLPADVLFQSDRLHPSRVGVALVVARIHEALCEWLPAESRLRPNPMTFVEILDDVGARFVVDELIEERAGGGKQPAGVGRDG